MDERIRVLERELAAEEAGEAVPAGPDRRFLLGALCQRQGRPFDAARWYLAAGRAAEERGDRACARALVRLAREVAPSYLDAVREHRRLEADPRRGMDG